LGPEFSAHANRTGTSSRRQRSGPDAGIPILNLPETASDCHRLVGRRRRTSRRLLPQPAMPQNFFNHLTLPALEERDDLHLRAALGTKQWVHLVDLFDQRCPTLSGLLGAGRRRRVRSGGWRGLSLSLGSQPPALVRIESIVANQMFPRESELGSYLFIIYLWHDVFDQFGDFGILGNPPGKPLHGSRP